MTAASRVGRIIVPHQLSDEGPRLRDRQPDLLTNPSAIPWRLPIADSDDIVLQANPQFSVGTFTLVDVAVGGSWDDSADAGSKFTDDTVDIQDAGTADILMMPATEAAGDKLVLAFDPDDGPPIGLSLIYSTAGIGGTVTFKYLASNGVWTAFPEVVDESGGYIEAAGTFEIGWQVPDDFVPMIEDEVSATVAYYYVAIEVATVYSTNPVGSRVQGYMANGEKIAAAFVAPATGLITHMQYAATASGSNADTILQVVNHTRKTRGLITLTKAVARARVEFTTPLYVQRGDELTIHGVQFDGTTEFENFVDLTLEIEL